MRNKIFCLLVLFLLIAVARASSDSIISRPVGVVRVTISTNEQKLVSLPFTPFETSLNSVLSGQMTGSTDGRTADSVIKWDAVARKYEQAFKADGTKNKEIDGKWYSLFDPLVETSLTLEPGEGFFLWNRQSVTQNVFLGGQVVLDATNAIILQPSLNLIGYPFSSGRGRWTRRR